MKTIIITTGNKCWSHRRHLLRCFLMLTLLLILAKISKAQMPLRINRYCRQLSQSHQDTNRVQLLLAIGHYYAEKPGKRQIDIDSAAALNREAFGLSEKLNYDVGKTESNILLALIQADGKDRATAELLLNRTLTYSKKYSMTRQQANAYRAFAYITPLEEEKGNKRMEYLRKALVLYKQAGETENTGRMLQELGKIAMMKSMLDTSALLLNQAMEAYRSANCKELQDVYTTYARIYELKGDFVTALRYGLNAVKTAEEAGDYSQRLYESYLVLGVIYNETDKTDLAVTWLQKARGVAVSLQDTSSICQVSMNIASIFLAENKVKQALALMLETDKNFPPSYLSFKIAIATLFVNAYIANKQPAKAEPYYQKLKTYASVINKNSITARTLYIGLILYLQEANRYAETYPYVAEYKTYANAVGNLNEQAQVEQFYFQADSATGSYVSAINHYRAFRDNSDSVLSTRKAKELNSLQLQFETERKDNDIRSLTQRNQWQAATIKKDLLAKQLMIGCSVLLFILLVHSYVRFVQKQRTNARLQMQQDKINRQNNELKKLLGEKEWLLKEIHHRVKNNLQIVISLLNSQSAYLDNKDALQAIESSQHRMYAMSLIHQRLYQLSGLSSIDMQWYIREMVAYMRESFDTKHIEFCVRVEEILLDVVQAVPLGLILNEAITNAIKYAFPKDRTGQILIDLKSDDTRCNLTIEDNGTGLPAHVNPETTDSLGMSLMRGLSEQIGGTMVIRNRMHKGLSLLILFAIQIELRHENIYQQA